jgi:hypothetical protein
VIGKEKRRQSVATRLIAGGATLALAAVVTAGAPAGASTVGVGTTNTTTSVLTLQLGQGGSLLNLALLTDRGGANIDPHAGTLGAAASLIPLSITSQALHLNISLPPITTGQPGGTASASGSALSLTSLGVPASLATATIDPTALASSYVAGAAHSTMSSAQVNDLSLVGGGLASINLLASSLGADALTAQADGTRGVQIGNVNLLDLGALLQGLGVSLASLPLSALSTLTSQLGLPLPGLNAGTTLADEVNGLSATLTSLRQALVGATTSITTPVDAVAQGVLGALKLPIPTVGSLVTSVNNEITQVQTLLVGLVTSALNSLDSFPLVQLSATTLGIATTAADELSDSSAGVSATPINLTVAGIKLPTVDPGATLATVDGIIGQADSTLNSLLGTLGLPANLLSLSFLNEDHDVAQEANYISSAAGLNLLTLKVAPLDPTAVLKAVTSLVGPTLTSILGSSPSTTGLGASNAMSTLEGLLGQAAPLLNGTELQIASLAGASTYTFAPVPAAGNPPTNTPAAPIPVNLPHTGGDPALAIAGLILAAVGVGAVRWRRVAVARHDRLSDVV